MSGSFRIKQRQGVVFYLGPEREAAKRYLRVMSRVFPELVGQLRAVYLYRQSEQVNSAYDGILWKNVTTDGRGALYAVGLSVEAVEQGPQYLQRLFLTRTCPYHRPMQPRSAQRRISRSLSKAAPPV